MNGDLSVDIYRAALQDYLVRNDEAGLTSAYDLGRSGLDAGCGLLQMLHVHEKALGIILDTTVFSEEIRRRFDASTRFLCEALSPFDLATSGYRDFVKAR